ncbi:hypothetical protein J2M53_14480 [Arthrobacter sp. zg-ZUI100]|uniref:5-methylcytosine restriction system specificity protein McrC n=1 Tax=Arthrobacter jiangjiafuii TaxID=2817475 RepID=UPI001AED42F6|nr:hypothetical protein [Arthrobacter jiangjiafuii]MBP3037453.1 hypothetical protein [Arthrobacter jiangjiafuii]
MLDHSGDIVGQHRIHMNIDVVYKVPGAPPVIHDAKYKVSSVGGKYANADQYQMLAYCTALGAPRSWLDYAGGGEHLSRRIVNTAVAVEAPPPTGSLTASL